MWLVFLIIWACIVVLVYGHLVFDYMYHYTLILKYISHLRG